MSVRGNVHVIVFLSDEQLDAAAGAGTRSAKAAETESLDSADRADYTYAAVVGEIALHMVLGVPWTEKRVSWHSRGVTLANGKRVVVRVTRSTQRGLWATRKGKIEEDYVALCQFEARDRVALIGWAARTRFYQEAFGSSQSREGFRELHRIKLSPASTLLANAKSAGCEIPTFGRCPGCGLMTLPRDRDCGAEGCRKRVAALEAVTQHTREGEQDGEESVEKAEAREQFARGVIVDRRGRV